VLHPLERYAERGGLGDEAMGWHHPESARTGAEPVVGVIDIY
jgi:hypothetical protein